MNSCGLQNLLAFTAGILLAGGVMFAVFCFAAIKLHDRIKSGKFRERGFWDRFNPLTSSYEAHRRKLDHLLLMVEESGRETSHLIERYRTLMDNMAAAIVVRDAAGAITYCSPYTEVLTGYAVSEIRENSEADFFLSITHEEDKETFQRALKVTAFGEPFQFRYRIYHKTGIIIWAETRTVPIVDEDGQVNSSLSITLDVTGTVLYQKQVEEKNRDLQDFTYMVSHDLKAPIFTIKGMLNVIEEDFKPSPGTDLELPLKHIANAAQRLEGLVGSVLEYSRIGNQEFKSENVDLNDVLRNVLEEQSQSILKSDAKITVSPELPEVQGDKIRLYQVFSNLIGNALKYRADGRTLEVSVAPVTSPDRRNVYIAVKDNGVGIANENIEKIFRPFQRATAKAVEGSGIGLASVKRVLEKVGGTIGVESTPGDGSTFTVSFRRAKSE